VGPMASEDFTGDKGESRRECPPDATGWWEELHRLTQHVGPPAGHLLADRIHELFLPVSPKDP
jgi:hypothetical protein